MPTRVVNDGGGERVGCIHGMSCVDEIYSGDQRFLVGKKVVFKDVEKREENSCIKNICYSDESSSSIGKNSDLCEDVLDKSGGDEEVQSSYKGPLDAMEALEEVLPIRRGISRFYNGKSKSFASLAGAASCSSSIKDVAKPDNAYTRKRRNLLACSLARDKIARTSLRNNVGGIAKRVTNSNRATLALAMAMRNPQSIDECNFINPLPLSSSRKDFSSRRSFSLADLQHCVSAILFKDLNVACPPDLVIDYNEHIFSADYRELQAHSKVNLVISPTPPRLASVSRGCNSCGSAITLWPAKVRS